MAQGKPGARPAGAGKHPGCPHSAGRIERAHGRGWLATRAAEVSGETIAAKASVSLNVDVP
jgi:hypothetical protein